MNKCQMLHETIVKDVVDVINDVKDFDQVEWIRRKNKVGSIAKQASNLILVFPVIVSTSLNIQTASIISKAIERKCVSLLQILFASINFVKNDNLQDYIAQFHSNLNSRLTLDDFINVVDKMSESGDIKITDRDAYEAVKEDMRNINYYLDNSFNETSINDYIYSTNVYGESSVVLEDKKHRYFNVDSAAFGQAIDKYTSTIKSGFNKALKKSGTNIKAGNINIRYGDTNSNKKDTSLKDTIDYFRYQLLPQDVQKANELMPTMMAVNFTSVDDSSGTKNTSTGIIGVKAKLYPVDAMEIVTRISSKYSESNNLFNLVRASTREISFFKDLAFAIDKAKFDAVNMARESNNAKMFKLLERRAAKNKFSSLLKKNDASPITSLVMSQDEVEYLKKYNNVDMEKSYVTRSILEAYNLMDIVIADESLEVARFLFDDGDGIYETLPFDALEKEAKDSSYKKVINLMSKINR